MMYPEKKKKRRFSTSLLIIHQQHQEDIKIVLPRDTKMMPITRKDWNIRCHVLFALSTCQLLCGLASFNKDVNKLPRLFLDHNLRVGETFSLGSEASHYIKNVMRFKTGFFFRTFNHDGEFLAQMTSATKSRDVTITVTEVIRMKENHDEKFPFVLYCAPLKRHRYKQLMEKSTEIGVSHIVPVLTKNTIISTISDSEESLNSILISSSEQSERLSLPKLHESINIIDLLSQWKSIVKTSGNPPIQLMVCRERFRGGTPLMDAIESLSNATFISSKSLSHVSQSGSLPGGAVGKCGLLVGPEGGFSGEELSLMEGEDFIRFVTLGPNILRSETAAIYALSVIAAKIESSMWQGRDRAGEPP